MSALLLSVPHDLLTLAFTMGGGRSSASPLTVSRKFRLSLTKAMTH